jgi:hypothetical protein
VMSTLLSSILDSTPRVCGVADHRHCLPVRLSPYATFGLRLRRAQDGHSHRPPRYSSQPVAMASATLLESEPQSNCVFGTSLLCARLSHSNSNAFRSLELCRTFSPISRFILTEKSPLPAAVTGMVLCAYSSGWMM